MKKTVNINLAGTTFHIDEDAYALLHEYLKKLKAYYHGNEEGVDIIQDIESRIAELFIEFRIRESTPINLVMTQRVIDQLGDPSMFEENEEETEKNLNKTNNNPSKKLFRDPTNKILGGVFSGVCAYANIKLTAVRIIAIIALIIYWPISIIYLVLWIIIPGAKTKTDFMQMRGIDPTVENIERFTQQEDYSKNRSSFGNGCLTALLVLILGILLLPLLLILLIFIIIIPIAFAVPGLMHQSLEPYIDPERIINFSTWSVIASLGLVIIPLLIILIFRLRHIQWKKEVKRLVTLILLIIWIMCGVQVVNNGVIIFKDFSGSSIHFNYKDNKTFNSFDRSIIDSKADTLWIKTKLPKGAEESLFPTKLNIKKSNDSLFHIKLSTTSKNSTSLDNKRSYFFTLKQDTLYISPKLFKADNVKFDDIKYTLFVPIEHTIFIDEPLKNILDDVKNTSNTWDYEMANHFWKQSIKGLERVDEK
ncbi:PspC domain-containing protein [Halosquirtibacter laminarini]|uniref:PspC domain-containing protein n=1 Tax=Halosquirtibacter laminarini TaxID=3374600 RepID=A0AC61NNI0_9BACT|nr:PspC domain-containing protein [Prolixibacteraceae bacterium]